jgi:hypothetical protein
LKTFYKPNKNKMKETLFILSLLITTLNIHAQEAIPATGGNASGSGGSVCYTIGQLVYTTITGTTGTVAQGVQQTFDISVVSTIEEAKGISLNCIAYPNPATDFLTLKINGNIQAQYIASLYDINGKLIENIKVESSETNFALGDLAPAAYFLKIFQGKKEIKIFKIIKH